MTDMKGLPVAGYRATQSSLRLEVVNAGKSLEELASRHAEVLKSYGDKIDQRDVARGITLIEEGFSRLARAVLRPQRLTGQVKALLTYPVALDDTATN